MFIYFYLMCNLSLLPAGVDYQKMTACITLYVGNFFKIALDIPYSLLYQKVHFQDGLRLKQLISAYFVLSLHVYFILFVIFIKGYFYAFHGN